jgi:hypothetical protein
VRRMTFAVTVVLLAASTVLFVGRPPKATDEPATRGLGRGARPFVLPGGLQPTNFDSSGFTTRIDNPYWPMTPGSRWVYRETDAGGTQERIEVTVTHQIKRILGIEARAVHDVATRDGQLVEDTHDWYAQDAHGNVWYLGEDTKQYENGTVKTTKGSWQAGVDGAQPGILVPADPLPGMTYRQEFHQGEAEDTAQVLSLDKRTKVPSGFFDHVLITKEYTSLEPNLLEHDFYARGVGPVLAVTVSGGSSREELVRFEHAP